MVTTLAFFSDNPGSNHAGYLFLELYEKTKISEQEAGNAINSQTDLIEISKQRDGAIRLCSEDGQHTYALNYRCVKYIC